MEIPEVLNKVVETHNYPLLFATISGAHLYGFPSKDSDYDLRGVHILPLEEVVGLVHGPETLEQVDVQNGLEIDLVTHDIKKFFTLMLKPNGYVLEQLFSPLIVTTNETHRELKSIAKDCISRYHAKHYIGFARSQWTLFEDNKRVKPLLYVYRVVLTGINLMRTGRIEANLVKLNETFNLPYIDELIKRKVEAEKIELSGDNFEFHQKQFDLLMIELEDSFEKSELPEEIKAKPALDDLLRRVRLTQ